MARKADTVPEKSQAWRETKPLRYAVKLAMLQTMA